MVLALSDESADKVEAYIDKMGLGLRVGSGSKAGDAYGVSGIPSSCLIGPDGKVVWSGHPSGLSKGKVKEALKGVKPRASSFLAIPIEEEVEGNFKSIAASMEKGDLNKAYSALGSIAVDEAASENDRSRANGLRKAIDEHVALLNQQAEAFVERLDLLNAMRVYEALGEEFARHDIGREAASRMEAIEKDETLSHELKSALAFKKLQKSIQKLATSKKRKKLEAFHEKWSGTRAGDRARTMAMKK